MKIDELNGFLLINKPEGITSFDVIRKLKKNVGKIKVGHCGTLDPLATGLLILCLGSMTKFAEKFSVLDKVYVSTIKLGEQTDTDDREGKVINTGRSDFSLDEIKVVLNKFEGKIEQVPPQYSAVKVNGVRAYKLARENKKVELSPKEVYIYEIDILEYQTPLLTLKTHVSKGTYIRALARDIGFELGSYGYVEKLCRTEIGMFSLDDSHVIKDIDNLDLDVCFDNLIKRKDIDKAINIKDLTDTVL